MTSNAEKLNQVIEIIADPFKGWNGKLTAQEREAGRLACRGKSNAEIGEALGVPANTAGSIIKRLSAKTGLSKSEMPDAMVCQIEEALK